MTVVKSMCARVSNFLMMKFDLIDVNTQGLNVSELINAKIWNLSSNTLQKMFKNLGKNRNLQFAKKF